MKRRWMVVMIAALAGAACDSGSLEQRVRADGGTSGRGPSAPIPPGMLPDGTCEQIEVGTTPGQTPRVMIVLDKSRSMIRDGLWRPAVRAVENLTESLNEQVAFGLASFPDYEPGADQGPFQPPDLEQACTVGSLKVDTALGTADAIARELATTTVHGNTPTAATLRDVAGSLAGPDLSPSIVVLVTDGAPNCPATPQVACECSTGDGECFPEHCLDYGAVDAVREVAERGSPVYVVGFRTSRWVRILDMMAQAGGTGRDQHIVASDGAELERALAEIAGSVLPCSYELDEAPPSLGFVQVTLNGEMLGHETVTPERGWRLVGDRTIELTGGACDLVRDVSLSREVKITVECEPVDVNLI